MTAEICVMNTIGVAMAADSAVTIGSGSKIYNSANKLFTLSKFHPIGIMIYGNAEFLSVPWETIIKVYREKLGKRNFPTVEGFSEDFIEFIQSNDFPELTSIEEEERHILNLIDQVVNNYFDEVLMKIKEIVNQNPDASKDEIMSIAMATENAYIEEMLYEFDNLTYINNFSEEDFRQIMQKYGDNIEHIIHETFENMIFSEDFARNLKYIVVNTLVKQFSESKSGIVIAGFGERELYPALHAYDIEGRLNGKLKYELNTSKTVGRDLSAAIVPFAQDDMVHTFIRGINPDIERVSSNFLGHIFNQITDTIIEQLESHLIDPTDSVNIKDGIAEGLHRIYDDYNGVLDNYKHENFTIPILSIVNSLPKDELAEMAESLVNLTSFKRRVSSSLETVGGPIDVAVITKGDGLVWIKRKHYFKQDLNQHFQQNYFRREDNESVT